MNKKAPGLGQRAKKYKKPFFGKGQRKFKANERKRVKQKRGKTGRVSRNVRKKRTRIA